MIKESLLTEHVLTVDPRPGLHQAPHEASVQLGRGRVKNGAALGVSDVDVTRRTLDLIMTVIMIMMMMPVMIIMMMIIMMMIIMMIMTMMIIIMMRSGSYQGLYHRRVHQAQVQGGLAIPAHNVHQLPVVLQDLVNSNNIALRNKVYHYSKGWNINVKS